MNKITPIFSTAYICIVFVVATTAQIAQPSLQTLAFIAGCWEINNPQKKMLVSEQWMTPVGGAMIGMSRTVRNGKLSGFEYMRIVQGENGIRFISKPSENTGETAFSLIKSARKEAVFENSAHDFPQRIIYKLTKSGVLSARIEGIMNGKTTAIVFPMRRTKCSR